MNWNHKLVFLNMFGKNCFNKILWNRVLHTSVSLMVLWTVVWALLLPYNVPEHLINHKIMIHIWPLRFYLFCFWAAVIQFFYFGLNSAIDVIEIYGENSPYYKFKQALHSVESYLLFSLVFPVSLQECVLFWSFYFWDREHFYPIEFDEFIPSLFNHVLHTFPFPLSVVYMLMSNQKVPSLRVTLPGLLVFQAIYAYFFIDLRITKGIWVYVVFDKIELTNEILLKIILGLAFTMSVPFLLLGYKLNRLKNVLKKHLATVVFITSN
ncbi:androgen-dependent TFPI-regulating protein-like [Rhodnius prolixus]|uniref:androgen-dependent TFPI-regulating protein-like n=1 Tax=Rhodnius prolixus TaxID=13249 RepID=UPI003D18BD6B